MPAPDNNIISVVGGGWSFSDVDQNKLPGTVIAVNEAGVLLPRKPKRIVSMDRLWTEHRWARLEERNAETWLRRSAVQNVDWTASKFVRIFENDHASNEMSEDPQILNGSNSGTCGINLAYLLRPKQLFLFGFDMCRHPNGAAYWHRPYEWAKPEGATKDGKYETWAAEFNRIALAFAAISTKVINVSPTSKITCWRRVSAKDLGIAR